MGAKQDELQRVEQIVDSYGCRRESLIAIMQDIQAEYKYLSVDNLELVAKKLGIGVAKVYSVATFYENFSLEPKGKYIVKVCNGTACHVRKSQPIYDALHEHLGLTGKKKTTTTGGGYTPGPGGSTSVVTPPVKTGDDTPIMLWVLLAALGLFTGGLAISLKKKGRIV